MKFFGLHWIDVTILVAYIMAVLAIVGFVHGHKVSKDVLVGAPEQESITV